MMSDDEGLKDNLDGVGHIQFIDTCKTMLNLQKINFFKSGLENEITFLENLLKIQAQEFIEMIEKAQGTSGEWFLKIAGGGPDSYSSQHAMVQCYDTIYDFTYKDVVYFVLNDWIAINKQKKIFPYDIKKITDFFKTKENDYLAARLWWMQYFGFLAQCSMEPKGLRKILCLQKSFFGKWSVHKWYIK
tara:strand:- start:137 stop:700 length:564 start_codon:yes stop_codon:yes gene_type:complete